MLVLSWQPLIIAVVTMDGETPTSSWPVVAAPAEGSLESRAGLGRNLWYCLTPLPRIWVISPKGNN